MRLMRSARIARMQDDAATELTQLQAAFEACPEEISPIYALMAYYRQRPEFEAKTQEFRALLLKRFEDPEQDLPIGVIEYLVGAQDAEEAELAAILGNVSRQVEKAAEPEPALLRIQAHLQRRFGQEEAAAATLERIWRGTSADDVLGPLLDLYFKLERWQAAADVMAPLVKKGGHLRYSYVFVLGKLGRYDEALQQVGFLASDEVAPVDGAASESPAPDDELEATAVQSEGQIVVDFAEGSGLLGLLKQLAWDLRDQGKDQQAEQVFRQLLAKVPEDPELQATVLNLYASEEERRGHAEALADTWQSETDPNALFEEGTQRLTAGDAAGAIDLLRRAAPEFPDLEPAWYNLGMAAYRLEDWETVVSAFGRAAELNPDRAQTAFFRGLALEKLDRCSEAVTDLERAAELDPNRALAHYYLAVCYRELGNQTAAAAAFKRYEATKK